MSTSKEKNATKNDSGVFVYIGPSIRGVIQNGNIFVGTKAEIIRNLGLAIEKYPRIATLIVRDKELTASKAKLKAGGNSLSIAYKALLAELK